MQRHRIFRAFCPQELFGEFERGRDVALGKTDDLLLQFAGMDLGRGGPALEGGNRTFGRDQQIVVGFPRLLNTLLRKRANFLGNEVLDQWLGPFSLFPIAFRR